MANPFELTIVTPRNLSFEGKVTKLIVRAASGDLCILNGHTNYLSPLAIGRLTIHDSEGKRRIGAVNGGFLSVLDSKVVVSAISFEWADQIDVERANAAKQKAEDILNTKKDDISVETARLKLLRASNRISTQKLRNK